MPWAIERRPSKRRCGSSSSARPRSSSWRTARGVSPSPHVLSRGNCLRSTTRTRWPASASQHAAAAPEGPPPTTNTSYRSRTPIADHRAIAGGWAHHRSAARYAGSTVTVVGKAYGARVLWEPRLFETHAPEGGHRRHAQPDARLAAVDSSCRSAPLGRVRPRGRHELLLGAVAAAVAEANVPEPGRLPRVPRHPGRWDRRRQGVPERADRHRVGYGAGPDRPWPLDGCERQGPRRRSARDVGGVLRRRGGNLRAVRGRLRDRPQRVAQLRQLVQPVG